MTSSMDDGSAFAFTRDYYLMIIIMVPNAY